jgi:hypothetical protein
MPATVIVNNLTVVHKSSGGTSVATPDVCKTPSPGGPVPVPYVNAARSRHTSKGSKQLRADGHPIMLKSSNFSTSSGDEPGTLGGVISGKHRGKAYPRSYSLDVKVEGQPVFRFTDMMVQNSGSPANAAGVESQPNDAAAGAVPADKARMIKMVWSKTQLCCGDPINLAVGTRNAEDGLVVTIVAARTDAKHPYPMETFPVEIRGDKADVEWLSRWRGYPFREDIPAIATQGTLRGYIHKSRNRLTFRNPPAAKQKIAPGRVYVPGYEYDTALGAYTPTGGWYYVDACYDIEISQGSLFVRRQFDFNVCSGGPVSPMTWRAWKREIEAVWDQAYYLHRVGCKRGRKCDCSGRIGCCKYPLRILATPGTRHGKVDLFAGGPKAADAGKPDLWWYSHTWWMEYGDASSFVRAHEFGHLIGCYDEYPEGACHPSRAWADVPDSVMNIASKVYPRHVEPFRAWFVEKAGAVVGDVELVQLKK